MWLRRSSFVWLESKSEKKPILNKYVLAELIKDSKFWTVKCSEHTRRNRDSHYKIEYKFHSMWKAQSIFLCLHIWWVWKWDCGQFEALSKAAVSMCPLPQPAYPRLCLQVTHPSWVQRCHSDCQADTGIISHKLHCLLKLQKVDPQSKYL